MDRRLFRRDQPPASTLLRSTVVPHVAPDRDLGREACAMFANNGHYVRFCCGCCMNGLKKKRVLITALLDGCLRCSTQ